MTAIATGDQALDVLLVEDDPAVQLLLTSVLEQDGVGVTACDDAESAMAHLRDGLRPQVVLCDLLLPGIDGIDLTAWIRDHHVDAQVPVLLVSSAAERETRLRALEHGADDLLSKPVDPLELRARVRSLARLSRARATLAARERIDAVLAEVSDGVALVEADGMLRDANPRARALLALPDGFRDDLVAHVHATFEVQTEVEPGESFDEVLVHRPRQASEPPLWLSIRLLPIPGDPTGGSAVVVRDVTQEQSAQALADLVLSSVAHKLRTPMTGIVSVASSLEAMVSEGPVAQLVGILQRSADRLDTSLRRIIEHAAAVARGQDDLPVLLGPDTVADVLSPLVDPVNRPVVESLREGVHEQVVVPIGPVVAAIDEFIDNARTAGDRDPELIVSVVDGELVVRLEDHGVGFQPEEAGRLFAPFHQEDRTGQDPRMGLGLPLVRHLVHRAGGRVGARSVPGEVTIFEARVPVGRPTGVGAGAGEATVVSDSGRLSGDRGERVA